MKDYIVIIVIFSALLFAGPIVFGSVGEGAQSAGEGETVLTPELHFPNTVTVLLTGENEEDGQSGPSEITVSVDEYLAGCLFAQISVKYHEEALKAQAVAAHTYLRRMQADGVEVSDDAATAQPFFTEEKAKERYGAEYDELLKKVSQAAEYGAKRIILYDGEPIYAVYHSISAGVTNTAYSVWGRDFPYLKSVDSSWDRAHPDYLCVNEMTSESIRLAMFRFNETASMPIDYSLWFVNPVKNDYGYVESVKAGESILSGGDMWRILGLRSTSFDLTVLNSDVFSAQTRGYGHGAGLSQYGADVLANRGYACAEILTHYYTDVTVETLSA